MYYRFLDWLHRYKLMARKRGFYFFNPKKEITNLLVMITIALVIVTVLLLSFAKPVKPTVTVVNEPSEEVKLLRELLQSQKDINNKLGVLVDQRDKKEEPPIITLPVLEPVETPFSPVQQGTPPAKPVTPVKPSEPVIKEKAMPVKKSVAEVKPGDASAQFKDRYTKLFIKAVSVQRELN